MPAHEPLPQEPSSSSPNNRRHPSLYRTENIRRLLDDQTLAERVRSVLDFMKSVGLNLPVLLWAISWNIPDLVSDPKVSAERTALILSDELLGILAHWRRPPRKHSSGIRTRAAYDTMTKFAINTVFEVVDTEMGALNTIFSSPQDELSEESLLEIKWKDMMADVGREAPTTWALLRHAAYTQKQVSRNTTKDPDSVSLDSVSCYLFYLPPDLVCLNDDCYGSIFAFASSLQVTEAYDDILQELWTCYEGPRYTSHASDYHEPEVGVQRRRSTLRKSSQHYG